MHSGLTLALITASATQAVAQLAGKVAAISQPGVEKLSVGKDGVNGPGLNTLPLPHYTITKRTNGLLPEPCVNIAAMPEYAANCPRSGIDVYDVLYADCAAPKVICRCGSSSDVHSPDVLAQKLGRVPLKGRQRVRVLMNVVNPGYAGAWANGADLAIVGSAYNNIQSVYLHEVGHLIDYRVGLDTEPKTQPWSGRAGFTNAIAADQCVADEYAKMSYPEAFSQMAVIAAWDIYRETYKNLNERIRTTTCLDNQFRSAMSILNDYYKQGQWGCASAYQIQNTCVNPPCASLKTRQEIEAEASGVVFEDASKYIKAYAKSHGHNASDPTLGPAGYFHKI
ncbi:hypothetical protein QBC35DRAFT_545342 [Podospora australis]|uniref:Conidiation-specific protein 13 n=1 Tax=Podospora australis TaxID=1536484 RepID=A0AAN6WIX4_9PEZI|nr:hypothetical protein QBC35DRAFT_545342 [Podospora australis]